MTLTPLKKPLSTHFKLVTAFWGIAGILSIASGIIKLFHS